MNINELAKEVHKNAVARGEWDGPPALPEVLCSIHAELTSALQEWKEGNPVVYGTCAISPKDCKYSAICDNVGKPGKDGPCKPEGLAAELADVILHTIDLMAALGVDVDAVVTAKHRWNLNQEPAPGEVTP